MSLIIIHFVHQLIELEILLNIQYILSNISECWIKSSPSHSNILSFSRCNSTITSPRFPFLSFPTPGKIAIDPGLYVEFNGISTSIPLILNWCVSLKKYFLIGMYSVILSSVTFSLGFAKSILSFFPLIFLLLNVCNALNAVSSELKETKANGCWFGFRLITTFVTVPSWKRVMKLF